jgi:hypothetical protein
MPVFKINTYGMAKEIKPLEFPTFSAYVQTFVECSLQTLFGLTLVTRGKFIEVLQPDKISCENYRA